MGKNGKDSNTSSYGVCQKLFTALKVSPAFQTIRRISCRPRDPTPTAAHRRTIEIITKPATDHQQLKTVKAADRVRTVPIEFVRTNTAGQNCRDVVVEKGLSGKNDVVSLHDKRKLPEAEFSNHRKKKPELASAGHDPINATFTEYIKRAGGKIRMAPESDGGNHNQKESMATGHGGVMKNKESFEDQSEDYTRRAKVNDTTSARSAPNGVATSTGKSVSFKTK